MIRFEKLKNATKSAIRNVLCMVVLSILIGIVCGILGTAFHYVLSFCKTLFFENRWLIWLLPLGGIVIVFLYHTLAKDKFRGTDMTIDALCSNQPIRFPVAPLIFISTAITHLFGGSSGREGAALQLGGSIASTIGRLVHLKEKQLKVFVMCGMSAAFSALFGTPVAAAVFILEFSCVGLFNVYSLAPCITASVSGYLVSRALGVPPEYFHIAVPEIGLLPILFAAGIGLICAWISILWIKSLSLSEKGFQKLFRNPYLRIVVGGFVLIVLTLLTGTYRYNGAGMWEIERAISGNADWYDWIFKLLFTVITLACGFKGGEIVPTLYIGAMFGCLAANLCGFDPGIASALGACALFSAATNCPIAAMLIAAELFGSEGLLLYCIACAVSFAFSGNYSLYHAQRMTRSNRFIEI